MIHDNRLVVSADLQEMKVSDDSLHELEEIDLQQVLGAKPFALLSLLP